MEKVGKSYKPQQVEDSYDAIVIGSGIGGLTAAALLSRHGRKKVLVLERHYTAGGFTHCFRRPGYEWDVGLHYIGEVNKDGELRTVFDNLTEGRLSWSPLPDVYDRVKIGEQTYEFRSGVDRFREGMKAYFPGDAKAIDAYIRAVLDAAKASKLYFAEKAMPAPISALAGGLMRARFLDYSDRTTAEVISELTSNKELIAVLTGQWGDYGLPPAQSSFAIHAIVANHYFDGAAYPIGGASQIAAGIAPLIEREGGQILVDAEVERILVDERNRTRGVLMTDGRELIAPIVISDAGAANTFCRLLPQNVAAGLEITDVIARFRPSMSHLCLYAGVKRQEGQPEFDAGNLWVYPSADHDTDLARFATDPSADFPVVFISSPSAKDPSFAERYPGRSTIEVLAPVPYTWFEPWAGERWGQHSDGYLALKEDFTGRLRETLEANIPGTSSRIDYMEMSTPLSTRHFTNYRFGEIYGLPAVPARFRIRDLGARTPVPGLFLTGQDVSTLGVTGALSGGIICASVILRRNMATEMFKPRQLKEALTPSQAMTARGSAAGTQMAMQKTGGHGVRHASVQ